MKTRFFAMSICISFVLFWVSGCTSGEDVVAVEEAIVSPTATPVPATETAVATSTPIPPTATPEPSPTPINYVAIVDEFVQAINEGGDVSDYLAEDAAVVVVGDAPIFVETMVDFVAFSQAVGSEFLLEDCQMVETAVACTATETNEWLSTLVTG